MERNVGVGMAGHAARMRNTYPREHDMIAVGEGMDIESIASPNVRKCRQACHLGAGKIAVSRHFEVIGLALKNADPLTSPLGERRIIGKAVVLGRRRTPVR